MKKKLLITTMLTVFIGLSIAQSLVNIPITSNKQLIGKGLNFKNVIEESKPAFVKMQGNGFRKTDVKSVIHKAPLASVSAFYNRPEGTYYAGVATNGNSYYPSIVGAGYTDWIFRNLTSGASTYAWTINGEALSAAADGNVSIGFGIGGYYMPSLTATSGVASNTYVFGSGETDQYCWAGADFFPATNACVYTDSTTNHFDFWVVGAGKYGAYSFGSGLTIPAISATPSNAIYSYYDKPQSPLYVDSINAYIFSDSNKPMPVNGKLYLSVYKIANGLLADVLATSTVDAADLITAFHYSDGTPAFVVPFVFKEIDELGFETNKGIVLKDSFAIKISGFSAPGFDLGFFSDYYNAIENTAAFDINGESYSWSGNSNLYIQLHSVFSTLYVDSVNSQLTIPVSGGTALDISNNKPSVYTTFLPKDADGNDVWQFTGVPTWLTYTKDESLFASDNRVVLNFTANALPSGMSGRRADITINSFGAETTMHITQGAVSGLSETNTSTNKVVIQTNSFDLTYTSDFKSVAIYNANGLNIGNYKLPTSGKFTIPATDTNKGVYFFKFTGVNYETIKVIR